MIFTEWTRNVDITAFPPSVIGDEFRNLASAAGQRIYGAQVIVKLSPDHSPLRALAREPHP